MEKKKDVKWFHWQYLILVLFLIFLVAFVVKPGIVGYTVYQNVKETNYSLETYGQQVNTLESSLVSLKANLLGQEKLVDVLQKQVIENKDELKICMNERETYLLNSQKFKQETDLLNEQLLKIESDKISQVKEKVEEETVKLNDRLSICQNNLDIVEDNFAGFVNNIARSVCCKELVDDPTINSFEIVNDKLVCGSDLESSLTC